MLFGCWSGCPDWSLHGLHGEVDLHLIYSWLRYRWEQRIQLEGYMHKNIHVTYHEGKIHLRGIYVTVYVHIWQIHVSICKLRNFVGLKWYSHTSWSIVFFSSNIRGWGVPTYVFIDREIESQVQVDAWLMRYSCESFHTQKSDIHAIFHRRWVGIMQLVGLKWHSHACMLAVHTHKKTEYRSPFPSFFILMSFFWYSSKLHPALSLLRRLLLHCSNSASLWILSVMSLPPLPPSN